MPKYCGVIGFEMDQYEDPNNPGVFKPTAIIERKYFGSMITNQRKWSETGSSTNDDLTINNQLSIVADAYAHEHWPAIKYAEINGVRWKVNSVDIKTRPRLILNLGGVWNGHTS